MNASECVVAKWRTSIELLQSGSPLSHLQAMPHGARTNGSSGGTLVRGGRLEYLMCRSLISATETKEPIKCAFVGGRCHEETTGSRIELRGHHSIRSTLRIVGTKRTVYTADVTFVSSDSQRCADGRAGRFTGDVRFSPVRIRENSGLRYG